VIGPDSSAGENGGHRILDTVIAVVAIGMVLYHLVYFETIFQGPYAHQATHLGLAMVLIFLGSMKRVPKLRFLWMVLVLASIIVAGYIIVYSEALQLRPGFPTNLDIVIGIMLVLLCLEASRQSFGIILSIVALVVIAYGLFGHLLPPPLEHAQEEPARIVSYCGIGLRGMFGVPLEASANYIFLFVVFGSLLQVTGATRFFVEVGALLGRRFRGAPILSAVVSSSLIGMVTGQASSNVAITGSFTIPWMKESGLKPEQAGAFEAAASSGGQVIPPIMGASAFLMALYLGVSYMKVCLMAMVPALLYIISIGFYGQFLAVKLGITPPPVKVNYRILFLRAPLFIVPVLLIVVILANGFSPMKAGVWANLSLVILAMLRKDTRATWKDWMEGLIKGASGGAAIAVAIGTIGPVMGIIMMTGLGITLASIVEALSGGVLIMALFITMIVSIILGTGLPTLAAYLIVAVVVSPALVTMGVSMEQAHFFCLYFAVFSYLTPPVAMAALVASKVAGASFMKTAWESMKAGAPGLLLPYFFVFAPALLMLPETPGEAVIAISSGLAGFVALGGSIAGGYLTILSWMERGLLAFTSIVAFLAVITGNGLLCAAWIVGFILVSISQWKKRKRLMTIPTEPLLESG